MKVLVISHNVFDNTDNMGKTLSAYFSAFRPEEIRQFYFHNDDPCSADVCNNYFRFTDMDALRSLFSKKGYGANTVLVKNADGNRSVKMSSIINNGRLSSFRYILRNTVWKHAKWDTGLFREWLREFRPDCIFFAGGDYSFSYRIALTVKKILKIPLIVCTTDDYYIQNICEGALFSNFVHRDLQNAMDEVMHKSDAVVTVSDSMSEKYAELFQIPAYTVYNSSDDLGDSFVEKKGRIAYIGNLRLGRAEQIADIGRAVRELNIEDGPKAVDVYSPETDIQILKNMTAENGIRFHGAVLPEKVNEVLKSSMAVIHTESFEESLKKSVQYSLSTKIAESLLNGQCIFAYGPEDIASMEYLMKNNAAVCANGKEEMKKALQTLISNPDYRRKIHNNARKIALMNHNRETEPEQIRKMLISVVEGSINEGTSD